MKTAFAILLIASACLALDRDPLRLDRFQASTTNGVAYIAATRAHYELVPENVPVPGGGTQKVITMRRMLVSTTTFTNQEFCLSLRCTPPFSVEVSTNLVTWEPYDTSTNSVYNIDVCAEQQVAFPSAFFRCKPMPVLTRIMRGF